MQPTIEPLDASRTLPDPGQARTLDDLVTRLRQLKVWAGDPSYETVKDRVNAAWREAGRPAGELAGKTTVVDCFRTGRRRLNTDLVTAVVEALHPDPGYVAQWRQALQVIIGRSRAASQVRVQERLPADVEGFTGRAAELRLVRDAVDAAPADRGAVVVVTGMAGVGKTRLAVHAGHEFADEAPFDQILFVDLRGFHPDQPAAEPTAVLDGFLRLLGVPGQQIPHDLVARTAAYRERLAGVRALVVLDNAADERQVRPLLPDTPGSLTLVTSRIQLAGLDPATHVTVDVFSSAEARELLARVAPDIPTGPDPDAAARIARRCGHLPLALGLITGHIGAKPAWTLTDHADRLDERYDQRRLDTGVELALDLSVRNIDADQQRMLRLLAVNPGQDPDVYAAAALAGSDLASAAALLDQLGRHHLVQPTGSGRYGLHDLVRAYAAGRASDEDPPRYRRAALTRLFDYYLATAAAAMDVLIPWEVNRRPKVPEPSTPMPSFGDDREAARRWLDAERPSLVAIVGHAAAHGWPQHVLKLSNTLHRYFTGGYSSDSFTVHSLARDVAARIDDPAEQGRALNHLAVAAAGRGQFERAQRYGEQACDLYGMAGDRAGLARSLGNLGMVEERLGRESALGRFKQALVIFQELGDITNEARLLLNVGIIEERLGRYESAFECHEHALDIFQHLGNRNGIAAALRDLGGAEVRLGRFDAAAEHFAEALDLFRGDGNKDAEAWTIDSIGMLHLRRGDLAEATRYIEQSLAQHRENGDRHGEAFALNALGEVATAEHRPGDAIARHTPAHEIAVEIGAVDEQARAQAGLGHAHRARRESARARLHFERALRLYADLNMPEAEEMRAALAELGYAAAR